jgi:thymidylate synthase (FAD)
MSVKLVWCTENPEQIISYCGRVSNPANQENYDTAPRLLKYLVKNHHWSPFEMASMCIELNTSRGVAAQILRHRSFCFQELSQRYMDVSEVGADVPHLRRQDAKNRQSSIDDIPDINEAFHDRIEEHYKNSFDLYKDLVDQGVAKECARFVLPLSTNTKMYMSGTIRSWIHYCQVRTSWDTQKEHRDIAMQVRDILLEQLPSLREILEVETKV